MKKKQIICIGTVAMDVLQEVETLPEPDGFAVIGNISYLPGGSASNVMAQASKLGARCAFVAKVGDDSVGRQILESMEQENIETKECRIKAGGTSLHTTIVVDSQGSKFILLNMGDAFLDLKVDELDEAYITDTEIYYTDLLPGEAAIHGLKAAKAAGMKIAVNLQIGLPMMKQLGVTREQILEILPMIDLFAPCREAAEQLFSSSDPASCVAALRSYCKGTILLTMGSDGAYVDAGPEVKAVHFPVEDVVVKDTTGAGDSFLGAFIYAHMIRKFDIEKSMSIATHCASITCSVLGARSGPDSVELEQWLSSQLTEEEH
ncbi:MULTISPECIES: carbohydrate kinase family protein [unclassified Oceanispirochaeta]|uniref:carbohydrate kinase family protein n=1 Tax=unclassified Oceanispirochaeta TaxID=2635722 RepID=UPI000E096B74|nr:MULTISPECIES: carbohydrate kinase family protein [unclassified Oceanispirochaeta]MBF9017954.1 carbohydrate kinase family protein [Oceanispirochaeta sp. M2]NPD74465.1 carbohydrate kinase family protein [Oceanispirochaeta sp. M1]RDG29674.1 carbohydrate kinase family protein [Oceanispirochaeta sp. M1]